MNKHWSKEERILILELYWQLSPKEIIKQKARHPMIISLVNKIGATDKVNSIYLRLCNFIYLDSNEKRGLSGVRIGDKELWAEFYNQWDEFALACQEAREALQIPPAVEGTIADDADFSAETRKVIIAQRIRQHDFRQRILANYENCCCISGISEPRLLVASHIVPWHIDKKNRLNPENGLCLSPLYDSAFDSGLISLDDEMKVILSPRIKNNDSLYPFFMAYEGKPITMPFRYKPHPELIKYHRTYIFTTTKRTPMTPQKIGLTALTALVLSSMIGSGIFSLPQNMAEVAGAEALIIGWTITGVGIVALGLSFWYLARLRPTLDGGIYAYARDGFGELVGFFSAWGYWLCATIGVTGYLVVAFEALGGFTDAPGQVLFGKGNTPAAFIGESAVVWAVYWLAARGVKEAAGVNLVATLVKVFPLLLFIGLALWFFRGETFAADWHGASLQTTTLTQVKDTMLITLWVFTGVEGAAVLSAHARKRSDVGLATVLGILIALALYVAITVLALGVLPRAQIAALANPSMAGVLQAMMGSAGGVIISVCLIVSVLASYLSWTLYSMEVPFYGAQHGAFPRTLAAQNANGVPHHSLRFSAITVQICLLLVLLTGESYNALLKISTSMILVPYLLIGAYLLKIALRERLASHITAVGAVATLYAVWILYAAGMSYLLLSVLLYVPGVALFLYAQTRFHGRFPRLKAGEVALLALLLLLLVPAVQQILADLRGAG